MKYHNRSKRCAFHRRPDLQCLKQRRKSLRQKRNSSALPRPRPEIQQRKAFMPWKKLCTSLRRPSGNGRSQLQPRLTPLLYLRAKRNRVCKMCSQQNKASSIASLRRRSEQVWLNLPVVSMAFPASASWDRSLSAEAEFPAHLLLSVAQVQPHAYGVSASQRNRPVPKVLIRYTTTAPPGKRPVEQARPRQT